MNVKSLTFREVQVILKNNGYYVKKKGGHWIFENDKGQVISLPYHSKAMSIKTVLREFKKKGIEI